MKIKKKRFVSKDQHILNLGEDAGFYLFAFSCHPRFSCRPRFSLQSF
jgi:hypothetical protein